MIRGTKISFSYNKKPIFIRADFFINKGDKVSLVGPNGAGKTTLLKLLTNKEELDEGYIKTEGSIIKVPQEVRKDIFLENSISN